mmetsp:Transcript_2477/g.3573  ORF Transcript_2477/g.3573 Transcript_2477/m.3573 type:complete len:262 (-) Transcript_2477:1405-2190(-)
MSSQVRTSSTLPVFARDGEVQANAPVVTRPNALVDSRQLELELDSLELEKTQPETDGEVNGASRRGRLSSSRKTVSICDKFKGCKDKPCPPRDDIWVILYSGFGAFVGIGALACLYYGLQLTGKGDFTLILGSFGASAVLLFGAPQVPFSQPRNTIGGHLIAVIIGLACNDLIAKPMGTRWLSIAVACGIALSCMQLTRTVHPPAGGTVLIAALGGPDIDALGWGLIVPTMSGALILVFVALVVNNFAPQSLHRRYPTYWY